MYVNGHNTNFNGHGPVVYMLPATMAKIMAYYRLIDDVHKGLEISGLGMVVEWEGDLLVHDFLLFKQEATGGDTELDPTELAEWLTALLESGQDPELIRLWWHKHPIQGWSTIDTDNIERMNNGAWLLSLVHCPNGLLARLDLYKPFRCTLDNLQIMELVEPDKKLDEDIKAEITAKVSRKWGGTVTQWKGQGGQMSYTRPFSDTNGSNDTGGKKKGKQQDPNTSASGTETNDEFWSDLADSEWESHYRWDEYDRGVHPQAKGAGDVGKDVEDIDE